MSLSILQSLHWIKEQDDQGKEVKTFLCFVCFHSNIFGDKKMQSMNFKLLHRNTRRLHKNLGWEAVDVWVWSLYKWWYIYFHGDS